MPTFIEKSNCRGNRPAGVVGTQHNLRSDITGMMLRDRHSPRFLVAPTGYGKSTSAYEYAQVVFDFEHVFWVRGESPCFLRDLDAGTIVTQVAKADPMAKLVVIDDVPHLDPTRSDALNEVIVRLVESDIEVIVTCVPSADSFSSQHLDKVRLGADDLLVTDDEIEIERLRGNLSREEARNLGQAGKAACLLWSEGGTSQLLKGIADEDLPGELELAVFCMLALGRGRIDDLRTFLPEARLFEDAEYLAGMFPYLGMDLDAGTFDSVEVDVEDVLAFSRLSANALGRASIQGDRNDLAMELSNMLLARGFGTRGTQVLKALATREAIAEWTLAHGWDLVVASQPLALEELVARGAPSSAASGDALKAMQSWALQLLGDVEASGKAAKRAISSSSAAWQSVTAAALSYGLSERSFDDAAADVALERALALRITQIEAGDPDCTQAEQGPLEWSLLLDFAVSLKRIEGEGSFPRLFEEAMGKLAVSDGSVTALRNTLLLGGSWYLDASMQDPHHHDERRDGAIFIIPDGMQEVVEGMVGLLRSRITNQAPSWPESVAVSSLQVVLDANPYGFEVALSPKMVSAARSTAVSMLMQVDGYRRKAQSRERERGEFELTHEDSFRPHAQPASKVASLRVTTPSLVLSMFGGLEAWIGADRTDPRQVKRKNAKIVLAMLALNRGREITKERLASTLWPEAPIEGGKQNLYVVWAYLKRVLKVGASCPYLISTQTGYKLDARYISSDVLGFDELCKSLLFGHDDKEAWEDLYGKVSGDYAEDLLPEVSGNDYIDMMRSRLRTQLVDGLVEASTRMARDGETRGAIWFAREALRRDRSREDSYIALMEAQISSNQRGAALDTYFECRRYLSEQLGIDPSKRVIDLYRSIIETEEDF